MNAEKIELLIKVARLYYEEDISQVEIAKRLELSRPMVSRLLAEARRRKLVEIIVHYPWRNNPHLEAELNRVFGLRDSRVLIADELNGTEILHGVGVLGAQLLEKYLKDGMTLAISRGTGVYSVVQELHPKPQLKIRTVQLQGAIGDLLGDGSDLAHFTATRYSGEFHFIHAPLLLESRSATEALLQEPSIRETLALASQADIALVGIGSIDPKVSSLYRHGLVDLEDLQELAQAGIVGDVAGRYFDASGQMVDIEMNHRLVCTNLEDLRKIPIIIGVACGLPKVSAICAALKAHNVNMLVTDSAVAYRLLERI